jgi:hypothetical protein
MYLQGRFFEGELNPEVMPIHSLTSRLPLANSGMRNGVQKSIRDNQVLRKHHPSHRASSASSKMTRFYMTNYENLTFDSRHNSRKGL